MLEKLEEDGTRSMGVTGQRPSQMHERDAKVRREPLDRTMYNTVTSRPQPGSWAHVVQGVVNGVLLCTDS